MVSEQMWEKADLSAQLENLITDNSDLQLKWISGAYDVAGQTEYRSYLTTDQVEANKRWIHFFLKEFTPVYEQLSLYQEYYEVRMLSLQEASYNQEQLKELEKNYILVAKELLMNQIKRINVIESLDILALDAKEIDKQKLLYLAANAPSTLELYEGIENKMQKNPALFPINSQETNQQLASCFARIETLINTLISHPEDELILFQLTDTLLQFYPDFKDVFDGIKGRKLNIG